MAGPQATTTQAWQRYLIAGMAAIGLYFALPSGGLAQAILFVSVHLSALVATIVGIRRNRPDYAVAWWVIVAGEALYVAANAIWYLYVVAADATLGFPSVTDAIYIPAYLIVLTGIAMLMWRSAAPDRTSVLDAAIVTLGVGGLSWVFLMRPYIEDSSLSVPVKGVAISYPVIDLLLMGAVMLVAFAPSSRRRAYWLLCLGLAPNLVADTLYVLESLNGTFTYGRPYFAGWMLFYIFLGSTALHPSMAHLSEPAKGSETVLTRPRMAFLAGAALVPPLTLFVEELTDPGAGRPFLSFLCAVLFALVLTRVAGLMSDITQRKRMEKAKDEFISVVSHELRTPLTSIRGALGLLASGAMGALPPKGRRMLEIASTNTDRLVRLINDILDIERMESGQATLQRQHCNAANLLVQAVDALRPMADGAGVTLSTSATSARLFADPDRVVQTLINLINNALKFSPPNSTVRVCNERNDGEVVFAVSDEGRGIPADKLEAIFGRFQQVDASDSRQKGGTGLGLAISRSIVSQHGGRIWADSTVGKGSTFSFTIPALPERQQPEPEVSVGHKDNGGPSVLVCDDDPQVLEVVTAMLAERGYDVIPATGGRLAFEEACGKHPDVILLDLVMPGMSGWDTMAALKEDPRTAHIPIVALTGLAREPGLAPGELEDWITKPIDQDTLFGALKRALSPETGPTKVLLVEDDDGLAQVLNAMFEHHGLSSFHAQTVQQALEMAERVVPELLVLDLGLPDGDGLEIIDFFRTDNRLRHTPVVIYTARDLDPSERAELEDGRTHIFTKSRIPPEEFHARVTTLLDRIVHSKAKAKASA